MDLYEYIMGKVVGIKEDYIVLDNGGIGYKIFTSRNSLGNLKINEMITMYIYFNLREDGVYLYGFTTEEELDMFNMLLLVSKVGPKVGLGILSTLTPGQIKLAILNSDSNVLCNGLMSLGYTRGEIQRVLNKIDTSSMDTEDIIRETLKRLSKQ